MDINIPISKARREEVSGEWKIGGKPYPKMGRKEEFKYCRERYPQIPQSILLKYHLSIKGVQFTPLAWEEFDKNKDLKPSIGSLFQKHKTKNTSPLVLPHDFLFSDGTISMFCLAGPEKDPYTIDYIDHKFWLMADGEVIEEIFFPTVPKYYGKKTSSGLLMEHAGYTIGTGCLVTIPWRACMYFSDKSACKMCDLITSTKLQMQMGYAIKTRITPQDVYELWTEALKEEGRWRQHFFTGGSDFRNNFQQEFEMYRDMFAAATRAGKEAGLDTIPMYAMMAPLDKPRLEELRDVGGIKGYSMHIETFGKDKFATLCPGKEKHQGYEFFIKSMIEAVDVFGPGNVQAGLVAGCELMYGYNDLQEALEDDLETTEFLAQHGVVTGGTCVTVEPGSAADDDGQKEPPLEFYCMLGLGRQELHKKYGLFPKLLDYKSQHYLGDSDLNRYL